MQHNPENCPACSGPLEQGYLLGKQNRIRWSVSPRGMTIFHGVPLIRLEDGFWRKRQWWSYAPSIPASRCTACRLVVFAYNNDARESPANERRAAVIISILLFLVAATIGGLLLMAGSAVPLAWRIVLGGLAILPLLLGGMLLRHARRYFRSG